MHGRRHWLFVSAGSLVGWTLLVLILATQGYVAAAYRGRPASWSQALTYPAVYYAIWAVLTPAIYWLVVRVPPGRGWGRFLGVHLVAGIAVSLIQARLFVEILPRVQPGIWANASTNERVLNVLLANVHSNLLIYAILIGATLAVDLYLRYRARELRASQLEARLARAELQALKMQLQPHFLFNTLHAIQALVHEDPDAADRTIARLADLLRMTLESHGAQEVPLRREVAFLDCYLQIEQTRLGDRLRLSRQIDEAALDAQVPVLILQPLVENAIKHGVASRSEGGTVAIHARREGASLIIAVSDDGPGPGGEGRVREGVGLANTRARLEQLYGSIDGGPIDGGPIDGGPIDGVSDGSTSRMIASGGRSAGGSSNRVAGEALQRLQVSYEAAGLDAGAIDAGAIDPGGIDPGGIDPGGIDPGGIDPGGIDRGGRGGFTVTLTIPCPPGHDVSASPGVAEGR